MNINTQILNSSLFVFQLWGFRSWFWRDFFPVQLMLMVLRTVWQGRCLYIHWYQYVYVFCKSAMF